MEGWICFCFGLAKGLEVQKPRAGGSIGRKRGVEKEKGRDGLMVVPQPILYTMSHVYHGIPTRPRSTHQVVRQLMLLMEWVRPYISASVLLGNLGDDRPACQLSQAGSTETQPCEKRGFHPSLYDFVCLFLVLKCNWHFHRWDITYRPFA